ncbi:sodium-dependent transporter [Reichenbachiella agarivorans]|uniref:Sodium-dependent transporter n=1 Tax=Reichenbachiella agarivorans TaxID=2979464 RepID=A0ABY6CM54_9BACT|nr:sodium-dependent transporter [Reichenbachiella agarivorans]UXP31599.1 sodium-dependent transporter [Reichenbachiella agarivorans]
MNNTENFSNRWGIILASLGMAIGAGNLWRFPRLAGQYGGAFIILWIVFLFVWSIPLLLTEFSMGKNFRKGVIGSFAEMAGKRYAWMGFFVTLCTLGIAFYYSVVTAWSLRYLSFAVGNLFDETPLLDRLTSDPGYMSDYWMSVSHASWATILTYIGCVVFGVFVLSRGIQNGLEKINKALIPSLFVLLIVITFISLQMEGGIQGLEYMFVINWDHFSDGKIWIEALSQSAWSTGAGWGLMITISSYSRTDDDITLNTLIGALGNNTASLIAGMAILPAVFALANSDAEAITYLQEGNQALTFTIIPELFAHVPGGGFLSVVFFLALSLAAFSSLLPMLELMSRNLLDLGLNRKVISLWVAFFFIVLGFPSAYSLDIFNNQDWVWGLGLIVSGIFILFGLVIFGIKEFKERYIDSGSKIQLPTTFFQVCIWSNLALGCVLIYWWMSQGYSSNPWFDADGVWNVLDVYSNASIVTQWGLVILIGVLINGFLYRKFALKK